MRVSIPRTLRAGTPDLPDVPPLVQYLILCFLPCILIWVETLLMRLVLLRCQDHPLIRIAQFYDPAPVVAACASYYLADGTKGAPPTFSIETLLRGEIVRAWAENCSDHDLECLLLSNLLVRFSVGIHLLDPVPDHTTRSRFHTWVSLHHPDALFRDVLTFLDRVDPEDASTTPQILDTLGVQSPSAWAPRVSNLLLDLCADLIVTWQQHAPLALQCALPPLDLGPILLPARPRRDARAAQAHAAKLLEAKQEVRQVVDPAADQHQRELQRVAGGVVGALVMRRLDHKWAWHILQVVELFDARKVRCLEDPAIGAKRAYRAAVGAVPAHTRAGRTLEGVAEAAAQHPALVGRQARVVQQAQRHARTQERQL